MCIAGPDKDMEVATGQLFGRLESDASIRAGDEGSPLHLQPFRNELLSRNGDSPAGVTARRRGVPEAHVGFVHRRASDYTGDDYTGND
jgi:hypothetical protein